MGRFPSRSLNGGASPHLCGALHHLSVGLPLCGALPHLAHSTVGLFSLYCGALLTLLWGFPTSPWGFISLWGSSPSRSLDCGALLTLLWGSSHSTVGLPHLSVGLHLTVGLFPISLTQLVIEGLFPLSLTQLHTHLALALDWILDLAPGSVKWGGGGVDPSPHTHLISPFPTWGPLTEFRGKPCLPISLIDSHVSCYCLCIIPTGRGEASATSLLAGSPSRLASNLVTKPSTIVVMVCPMEVVGMCWQSLVS